MIPLEAARLGIQAWGIDYSPVATLAGKLLADYPLRDWNNEPNLPFDGYQQYQTEHFTEPKLLRDVRLRARLWWVTATKLTPWGSSIPSLGGKRPWGYRVGDHSAMHQLSVSRFRSQAPSPLRSSKPATTGKRARPADAGQSYRIVADSASGTFHTEIHDGTAETSQPTLVKCGKGQRGKSRRCAASVATCSST